MRKGRSADGRDDAAEGGDDENEVHLGGLHLLGLHSLPDFVDDDRGEVVQPLTDRVEHHLGEVEIRILELSQVFLWPNDRFFQADLSNVE